MDSETRSKFEALCFGNFTQAVEIWPRPLGVHMVSGNRGDAAPVVDACVEEDAEIIRKIWWRLKVHIRRENDSGESDGI